MNHRCASAITLSIFVVGFCTGCETPPQPVKEEGWEANAASAAQAEPAPEVRTAHHGSNTGRAVVDSAMKSIVEAKDTLGEDTSKKPAPLVAVAILEPNANLNQAPGPEASAAEVARWLSTAHRQGKSGKWIQRKLNATKPDQLDQPDQPDQLDELAQSRIFWTTGDYDGDGKTDLAAAFYAECKDADCEGPGRWSVGVVWGTDGWSQLAKSKRFAPEFLGPADMTGDGQPELIFTYKMCGAHTCYENLQVLSAHGQKQFREIFRLGDEVQAKGAQGLPQTVELVRPDDSLARLKVSGGLVGSAGAGEFQRLSHAIWGWDSKSQKIEQITTRWEPSTVRMHRLHDALVALERGDTTSAKADLTEVIFSDKLRELPADAKSDPQFEKTLRTQLGETARFVLARVALQGGDEARAKELAEELEASEPNSPATRATAELLTKWSEARSVDKACQAAAKLFPANSTDDWELDAIALGYNASVKFTADVDRGLCAGLSVP